MFTHQIHEDEELLEVYRKHEMTLVPKIFEVFLLIFIPWFLGIKYDFVFSTQMHMNIFIVWTIFVILYCTYFFAIWAVNKYIVTTRRLLHIEHVQLFHKVVTETPLDRILNVSFRTTGFFSTIFGYGDVIVQVVGLEEPIILGSVPHPAGVKDFLWKIHLEYGGDQKITYTIPEIAPADKNIPYAPAVEPRKIIKRKVE